MMPWVLAIDDDETFLKTIKKNLSLRGFNVDTVANPLEVLDIIENHSYNCILLDVKMPGVDGLDLLHTLSQKFPTLPIIMISGQATISIAVESLKEGAYDFIEKPIDPQKLAITITNAIQKQQLLEEKETIFEELESNYRIIGQSDATKHLCQQIRKIAVTDAKVLILGENGTGKELVAWAIHHNSKRNGKPYVKLNCAAVPSELLEAELFGYRKGAFTGATHDHKGKFLVADGGTIFLDEIGDMTLQLQSKLLRVIENNVVDMLGENISQKVDVRIMAATNKELERMVAEGKFREDLFYRLNVVKIQIPPLRERRDDILPLAYHFLKQLNETYNRRVWKINRQAEALLLNYPWPGNVRQLRNVLEKLVIFAERGEIGVDETMEALGTKTNLSVFGITEEEERLSLQEAKIQFEKQFILQKLNKYSWRINETAEALGIDRTNLFRKIRRLGIKK